MHRGTLSLDYAYGCLTLPDPVYCGRSARGQGVILQLVRMIAEDGKLSKIDYVVCERPLINNIMEMNNLLIVSSMHDNYSFEQTPFNFS